MTEISMSKIWLRRFKIIFSIALLLLSIQLFLGYSLFTLKTNDDIDGDGTHSSSLYGQLIEERISRQDKAIFSELFAGSPSIDDEDFINSNSILNFKEAVVLTKNSASAKEHSDGIRKVHRTIVAESNNNIQSANIHLHSDELNIKTKCDIVSKEAISAILRATTNSCKELIANISCAIQNNEFYPIELPNQCPHEPYQAHRSLGCYKDDKKFRTLSGYYINFKTLNTPTKCIQLCLQSGFVYAGVQYSTECFCGNTISEDSTKLPDPQCNYKCSGDSKQTCGGYFTIRIFETGIKKFTAQVANLKPNPNTPKVRIAFLLTLNGRALRQVRRLLKLIYSDQHFYYIHVDIRQDYLYRQLLELEKQTSNIRLARKRYATIWGGASLLRMLLDSMRSLLQSTDWKWDFVINLSESDFLVKSMDDLVHFLTANRNRNFVKSHGREVQRFVQKQGLDKTFVECDTHMWRIGDRSLPHGIQIDGGSDWVALSRSFVEYVTIENDPLISGLLKIFHHTLLPAESFFHTALRNSKFCNTYVDNNLHVTNWKRRLGCKCQYKHVVDWCGCSPNDFKPEDWPRLLATEAKQLYFARKFEPIVNQAVIHQLEEWIMGPYPLDYPNLHSYWQSIYNVNDKTPNIDEVIIATAASISMKKLPDGFIMKSITEITSYMDHDRYKGFLIRYEISPINKSGNSLELELLTRPNQFGQVSRASSLGKRIQNAEVSTEYDQKEQIARNYAKIMSINSEPTFVLYLSPLTVDSNYVTASTYNLTILWIDPAGHLGDVSEIYIDASSQNSVVAFSKSNLRSPLLPGSWTAKLVDKENLIAQCNFVIIPKIHRNENYSNEIYENHLKETIDRKIDQQYDIFLPNTENRKILETEAIEHIQLRNDEQIVWINLLTEKFFQIKDICTVGDSLEYFKKWTDCKNTNWSSFAPDPKSEIFNSS